MFNTLCLGRRKRDRAVLAACACFGLLFVASVCVQAQSVEVKTQDFSPAPNSNRRDMKAKLTFDAPDGFRQASGSARLVADGIEAEGNFITEASGLKATFNLLRKWEDISFERIELAGQLFPLEGLQPVNKLQPRPLAIDEISLDTTDKTLVYRARFLTPLEGGARLCSGGPYLRQSGGRPGDLKVEAGPPSKAENGWEARIEVSRPQARIADAELVIEVCGGSEERWVYAGNLPELGPIRIYSLGVSVEPVGGRVFSVVLKPALKADAERVETKVLQAPSFMPQLSRNAPLVFEKSEDSYLSEVRIECTSGERALEGLTLMARDPAGAPYLFQQTQRVVVCPRPPWWQAFLDQPFFWGGAVAAAVSLIAYIGYLIRSLWRRRSTRRPEPEKPAQPLTLEPSKVETTTGQSAPPTLDVLRGLLGDVLQSKLSPIQAGITELKGDFADFKRRFPGPDASNPRRSSWEESDGPAWTADLSPGGGGANLAELVNRWWREGADRTRAGFLLQSGSVKVYRSVDINESLRNLTNRTFTFQVTDGLMEWLGQQRQEELLIVPCDPRLFETGDALKFLGILFEGVSLERSLTKVRFRRVRKPCRLQRDPGSKDRYRLAQRGQIEMEGQAEAASTALDVHPMSLAQVPQVSPSAPEGMSESKLTRIVRDAVVEVVSRELIVRVEDLTVQVRSLREIGPQSAERARLEPNLTAAVEVMRKGIAACDGELRAHAAAIQEVKSLVEALRGDLLRIGSELRHPDPAPPVSQGSFFSKTMEVFEIDAAVDRLGERPAQPSPQESSFDMMANSWHSSEMVQVPEQILAKMEKWWPNQLPAEESNPDGEQLPEPSAYLWRLEETQRVLAGAAQQRGWEVKLVHLRVPDNSPQGDASVQITEPVTISRDYRSASDPGDSFADALLFQFALSIQGDAGGHIALLPAAGLRVDKYLHVYSRLTLQRLPVSVTRLTQVVRPAVLSPAGQGGIYTVVSPLKAKFQ